MDGADTKVCMPGNQRKQMTEPDRNAKNL